MNLLKRIGLHETSLEARVAIVTGTARGIGEHTAQALANVGARVVLVDIAEGGEALARTLRERGQSAHFIHADVRKDDDIARIVAETEDRFGPIDIVINNAASLRPGSILELPIADWDDAYRTHLRAAVVIAKHVLPGMLARQRGVLLSMISLEGMPALAHYCASKVGLRSMMLSLAKEIPPDSGVSVFSVVPGSVDTPLIQEIVEALASKLGVPRDAILASVSNNPGYAGLVPPEHTAAALAWLCVHAAQFHGQFVDGYLPLSQSGVIRIDPALDHAPSPNDSRIPNPQKELAELVRINRTLEKRIEERTRELVQTAAQLEAANQKLEVASLTDPLTGLWNRRYIDNTFADEDLRDPPRASRGQAVVLVDIDHFKRVNDHHGHHAGDRVLQRLADIMRETLRGTDTIARWGGEEFLIVMRDIAGAELSDVIERLRHTIAAHEFDIGNGKSIRCTCSIGVAPLPSAGSHSSPLPWLRMVEVADRCLYAAKASGRNAWISLAMASSAAPAEQGSAHGADVDSLLVQGLARLESGNLNVDAIRWQAAAAP